MRFPLLTSVSFPSLASCDHSELAEACLTQNPRDFLERYLVERCDLFVGIARHLEFHEFRDTFLVLWRETMAASTSILSENR